VSLADVDNSTHCSDATETLEHSAVVEKVIELARRYAAATPSEQEFKALKQRLATSIKSTEPMEVRPPPLAPLVPIRQLPRTSDFKHDQLASTSTHGRPVRVFAYASIVAVIGAGCGLWWNHPDEAQNFARDWGQILSFSSTPMTKSQLASLPAAAPTSPTAAERLGPIAPNPQAARRRPQDVDEKREVSPDAVLTTLLATKQDARPKVASPPFRHAKSTTNEESTPTTIKGWTLHDIADGVAILEGPNGIRRVKRGDLVPGVGKIESIVRWGNRWIVVTSSGLISTP
jgi:hypothetical protein